MKRLLFLTLFFALSATAFPQEIKKTLIAIDAYKYNEKGKEIEKREIVKGERYEDYLRRCSLYKRKI